MIELAFAEHRVPRYTSYPTASHFTSAVGASEYTLWLSELPEVATLSIYLHVPYCTELCHYCGCHTKAVRRPEPLDRYCQRLAAEIDMVSSTVASHRVLHTHWGGGTPSILGEARLEELTARLRDRFDFSAGMEHAIELDPRRLTRSLAQALARVGVNRASLGVQELAPHIQTAIGRVQPFERVAAATLLLRNVGIERINFDLMYGLPRQTAADVRTSAERAASLRPNRIALFGYAHMPWFKKHQRLIRDGELSSASERLEQAHAAAAVLCAHGYLAIGLDHFALPDDDLVTAQHQARLRRNFQGYTTDASDALIGFGASAIGRLPQGFVQNHVDIGHYARAIAEHRFAIAKGIQLTPDDRRRARIIEGLMCHMAIDLKLAKLGSNKETADQFSEEIDALRELAQRGWVEIKNNVITITEEGRPFVRLVAAVFDAHLSQNRGRYSRAV